VEDFFLISSLHRVIASPIIAPLFWKEIRHLQLQLTLGLLMALATTGLILLTGSYEEARMSGIAQTHQAQGIEVGAKLFETHCRSCHGLRGEGVGQLGPALKDAHFFADRLQEVGWPGTLEDYVIASIAAGRITATRPLYAGEGGIAVMSAWSSDYGGPLRDDQTRNLAAFVLNWEATALGQVKLAEIVLPTPSAADQTEAVVRGRDLFLSGGCADCHTIEGLSQAEAGPDLNHIGSVAATRRPELSAETYLRESFLIPNAYYVTGYEPEAVEARCGGILSEQQLDDLVVFLLSQE
jgi:mono/diheme cytochrome c family protein